MSRPGVPCFSPSRGFSLVELLVVVVVLGILAAIVFPLYLRGTTRTTPNGPVTGESPIQRGHSVGCINNLQQLRSAYQVALTMDDENRPTSLAELRGIPESMLRCPVGGQPYHFDPASGRISCVQPGHERH